MKSHGVIWQSSVEFGGVISSLSSYNIVEKIVQITMKYIQIFHEEGIGMIFSMKMTRPINKHHFYSTALLNSSVKVVPNSLFTSTYDVVEYYIAAINWATTDSHETLIQATIQDKINSFFEHLCDDQNTVVCKFSSLRTRMLLKEGVFNMCQIIY